MYSIDFKQIIANGLIEKGWLKTQLDGRLGCFSSAQAADADHLNYNLNYKLDLSHTKPAHLMEYGYQKPGVRVPPPWLKPAQALRPATA